MAKLRNMLLSGNLIRISAEGLRDIGGRVNPERRVEVGIGYYSHTSQSYQQPILS